MPYHNIAFIYYQDDRARLNAITPEFITETYGIPREGPYVLPNRSVESLLCHEFKKHEGEIDYGEIEA